MESDRRGTEIQLAQARPDVIGAQQQFKESRASIEATALLRSDRSAATNLLTHKIAATDNSKAESSSTSTSGAAEIGHGDVALHHDQALQSLEGKNVALSPPSQPGNLLVPDNQAVRIGQSRKKEGFLWANARPITHQGTLESVKHWQRFVPTRAKGVLQCANLIIFQALGRPGRRTALGIRRRSPGAEQHPNQPALRDRARIPATRPTIYL